MLKINIVNKKYKDSSFRLQNFNFVVESGKCICLIGLNGSGKSTVLNCIASTEHINEGNILLDKINITSSEYIKNIGFSLNKSFLIETMSPMDFLLFHSLLLEKKITTSMIESLLSLFFEKEKFNESIESFSLGMKKKVELCAALIGSPKLLLLDEPFNGLDFVSSQKLINIINELKRRGKIVIIAMHNIDNINKICDSVIVLNNGSKNQEFIVNNADPNIISNLLEFIDISKDSNLNNSLPEWI